MLFRNLINVLKVTPFLDKERYITKVNNNISDDLFEGNDKHIH